MWGDPPLLFIEVVMSVWTHCVLSREPWRSMPADDRAGEMRRVVAELLDGGGDARARRRRLRSAATNHGAFRRAQGCAQDVVAGDFAAVPESLQVALRACGLGSGEADNAVDALSLDCHIARRAAQRARSGGGSRSWEYDE